MNYKEFFPYFANSKTIYLDSGATSQKPKAVIDELDNYYLKNCASVHRSSFGDANVVTRGYENTRKLLGEFIGGATKEEIIFTKGATESLNLLATSFGFDIKTIIISSLEHHSNIVPWHMQGRTIGAGLEVVECGKNLEFDYEHLEELLKKNPKSLVSLTHISNAFGVMHDIKRISKIVHKYDSWLCVDGAQSLAHIKVDVKDLACDFFIISAHKTFGPTGLGAIYIKKELLEKMKPYQGGGASIASVSYEKSVFLPSPYKFEAGTPNIAAVLAFSKSLEFLQKISFSKIEKIENKLYAYLYKSLEKIEGIIMYNDANAFGARSFNIEGISHDDIGILLDKQQIAVRVGHHCCMPIMEKLGIKGTIRVSLSFYNDKDDIDKFIKALKKALSMLKG